MRPIETRTAAACALTVSLELAISGAAVPDLDTEPLEAGMIGSGSPCVCS